MKKILLMILTLSLFLTGCGTQTDYETMTEEIKPLTNANAIKLTIGSVINGTDSELDGTSYELFYTFNTKDSVIKADVDDVQMYFTDDAIYINLIGTWLQKAVELENYGTIQEVITYKDMILNLPKGNHKLTDSQTGIESIDQKLAGTTLNDVIVMTSPNQYSITGLEDKLKIDTTDQVRFDYTGIETGTFYIIWEPAEKVTIPEEALNATSADDLLSTIGAAV